MNSQRERFKVLSAGIFSLILAMGVARFAYTPLLPIMQQQAGLGLAEAGWLAALNYAGYLSGALIASLISDLVLKDRLYRIGLVVAIVSTAMMGLTTDPWVWMLSRFIAGLSSAAGMLLGTGLILNWLIRHNHRPELGIHFRHRPGHRRLLGRRLADGRQLDWREQWFAFTALACLLIVPALAWLPAPDTSPLTKRRADARQPPSRLYLGLFMAAYFCAGFGYVISATFIVAIVNKLPGLPGRGRWLSSPSAWRRRQPASTGISSPATSATQCADPRRLLQIVGIVLPVAVGGLIPTLFGALLFGGTFIGMVSLVLTMAGRYYPTRPAKMMGKMTLSYGAAQIIGPAVVGWLATRLGDYSIGLYLAGGMMVVGTVLLAILKLVEKRDAAVALQPCLQN
jgi:predicted MFS family arabinose efflux permease